MTNSIPWLHTERTEQKLIAIAAISSAVQRQLHAITRKTDIFGVKNCATNLCFRVLFFVCAQNTKSSFTAISLIIS